MAGQATFQIEEIDHLAGVRAANLRQLQSRRFLVRMTVLSASAAALISGLVWTVDRDPWAALSSAAAGVIGGLSALLVLIGINWLLLPRRARRLYLQNRLLRREVVARWSDSGLEWESPSGHTRLVWTDVHAWENTSRITLVYLTDLMFHMIPRRALDEAAASDLLATLQRCKPPKR